MNEHGWEVDVRVGFIRIVAQNGEVVGMNPTLRAREKDMCGMGVSPVRVTFDWDRLRRFRFPCLPRRQHGRDGRATTNASHARSQGMEDEMGLDLVELRMEIEDAFGVDLPDEDSVDLETVGDVHAYLCRRLGARPTERCRSQHTFYRLRSAMLSAWGLERTVILPAAQVGDLLPFCQQQWYWQRLGEVAGLQLPPLTVAGRTGWAGLILIAGMVVVPLATLHSAVLALIMAALVIGAVFLAGRPDATGVVMLNTSMRELVHRTVAVNAEASRTAPWTDEGVWGRLKQIVVDQLGVEPRQVTRSGHLVRDLGAG